MNATLVNGCELVKQLNWQRNGEIQLLTINNHFGPMTLQESEIQFIQLVAGRVRRSAIKRG